MEEHKQGTLQSWGRLFTPPSEGWEAGRPGKLGCWEIGSLGGWGAWGAGRLERLEMWGGLLSLEIEEST